MSSFFIRQGTNAVTNAKNLTDIVLAHLQQKHSELCAEYSYLGEGFEQSARPWALVFCNDMSVLESAIGQTEAEQRVWLDMIRICRVETAHQLRAVLCGIHIQPKGESEQEDILSWIEREKNGQPPSLIVVFDFFNLMLRDSTGEENLRFKGLSHLLLNLVETCAFLSERNKQRWVENLGETVKMPTELIITDGGRIPMEEQVSESIQKDFARRVNRTVMYYIKSIL